MTAAPREGTKRETVARGYKCALSSPLSALDEQFKGRCHAVFGNDCCALQRTRDQGWQKTLAAAGREEQDGKRGVLC